jgi:flagellar biosynthetic protein FlhB
MADADNEERTEDPTETRREDFRKRGQVAQTRELNSVLVLLGAALIFWVLGRFFLQQILDIFNAILGDQLVVAARGGDWKPALIMMTQKALLVAVPLWGLSFVVAIVSSVVQTGGFLSNEEALSPDWERLNPVEGFKRMFSMRALVEGLKAIIKISVIVAIVFTVLRSEIKILPLLPTMDLRELMSYVGGLLMKVLGIVGAFMAAVAAMDYFFQWWDLEKRMRMTKQEVKEEHRSREGDPLIKSRIRRLQREMTNKRMMEKVPKADVVITNPTHIAVALKYENNMIAPQLVAKGAGLIAEKIKAIARENRVPIVENKPLARTIFKTMKIGQGIPRELYTAVAKVLSYVYRLKNKTVS